jgi:hypothetical protein
MLMLQYTNSSYVLTKDMQTIFPYLLISPEVTNESRHFVHQESSFPVFFLYFFPTSYETRRNHFCSDIFILFPNK